MGLSFHVLKAQVALEQNQASTVVVIWQDQVSGKRPVASQTLPHSEQHALVETAPHSRHILRRIVILNSQMFFSPVLSFLLGACGNLRQ